MAQEVFSYEPDPNEVNIHDQGTDEPELEITAEQPSVVLNQPSPVTGSPLSFGPDEIF